MPTHKCHAKRVPNLSTVKIRQNRFAILHSDRNRCLTNYFRMSENKCKHLPVSNHCNLFHSHINVH